MGRGRSLGTKLPESQSIISACIFQMFIVLGKEKNSETEG